MGKIVVDYEKHYESFFGRYWGLILFPLLPFWLLARDDGMAGYLDIDGVSFKLKYKKKEHPQVIEIPDGVHQIVYRKKSKFALAFHEWARSSGGDLDRFLDSIGANDDYKLEGFVLNFGPETIVKLYAEGGILRKCKVVDVENALDMPEEEKKSARPLAGKKGLGFLVPILIVLALILLGAFLLTRQQKSAAMVEQNVPFQSIETTEKNETQTEDLVQTDTKDSEPSLDKTMYIKAEGGLNLRAEPDSGSAVLVLMPEKAQIVVKKIENGWALTEYEGSEGWCSMEFLVDDPALLENKPKESYTQQELENAMHAAEAIVNSYFGKPTKGARTDITVDNVIAYFEEAQRCYNYWMNFGGQFQSLTEIKDAETGNPTGYYFVNDPSCNTVEALCDRYFSLFSDGIAKDCLRYKVFLLDGKLVVTSFGAGLEGLYLSHSYQVDKVSDDRIVVRVLVKQYQDYPYTDEGEFNPNAPTQEVTLIYPCVIEDGGWVFEEMGTIYS